MAFILFLRTKTETQYGLWALQDTSHRTERLMSDEGNQGETVHQLSEQLWLRDESLRNGSYSSTFSFLR